MIPTTTTTTTTIDGSTCYGEVLVAYYLNAMPQHLFRLRIYTFIPPGVGDGGCSEEDESKGWFHYYSQDEIILVESRVRGTDACSKWNCNRVLGSATTTSTDNAKFVDGTFVELERCDILQSSIPDQVRHTYLFNNDTDDKVIASNSGGSLNSTAVAAGQHAIMI